MPGRRAWTERTPGERRRSYLLFVALYLGGAVVAAVAGGTCRPWCWPSSASCSPRWRRGTRSRAAADPARPAAAGGVSLGRVAGAQAGQQQVDDTLHEGHLEGLPGHQQPEVRPNAAAGVPQM